MLNVKVVNVQSSKPSWMITHVSNSENNTNKMNRSLKRESLFRWNDTSTNIRSIRRETGKNLSINDMYKRKWRAVKTAIDVSNHMKVIFQKKARARSKSVKSRQLKFSVNEEIKQQTVKTDEERKISREVAIKTRFKKV